MKPGQDSNERKLQLHHKPRRKAKEYTGKEQSTTGGHFCLFFACIVTSILVGGCSQRFLAGADFKEAHLYFSQGNYNASLSKYQQIIEKYPLAEGDRALFEMGMIYSHFRNVQKDYRKSLECFQKLIKDYPGSGYRQESDLMIYLINKEITKDNMIVAQHARIGTLEQEVKSQRDENIELQKKVEALEQTVFALRNGPADKILIEKKGRRLTLFAKNKALKTYKIALGGDPNGPKRREGDDKTPEGIYFIDARNTSSRYHLSLHISYPNEQDRRRAKELGVPPGGDIMIHGMKAGSSRMGEKHTDFDWTNGCIAVTNEEIEEIDKLVPNGTVVEIRP
jgi:tetratricopeptide (TPR) repeat protein